MIHQKLPDFTVIQKGCLLGCATIIVGLLTLVGLVVIGYVTWAFWLQ